MKILFLSNHFITLYAFRKELIKSLVKSGHDVIISTPADEDNQYFTDLGCKIIETFVDRRGVNPIKDLKTLVNYFKLMNSVKPDVVLSYTIKPNIYGSLVSNFLGFKQICNITGTGATFLKDNFISKIATFLYRISVKKSYKVFFQNSGDRDIFISRDMIGNNWSILPGSGVNLEQYEVKKFPSDEMIGFIFIGRVMKLKGIDEYLEAARNIKPKHPNTEFYIAGWNEEEAYINLIKSYQEKGYVKYIGFQKNIGEWIEKCQCTILPSHGGEGVPNVLLESAATGRVCIASKIDGSKDVIENGVTGYIFDTGKSESLIDRIEEYLKLSNEQRKKMGLLGREKVEREFNREIVIKAYLDEINCLS